MKDSGILIHKASFRKSLFQLGVILAGFGLLFLSWFYYAQWQMEKTLIVKNGSFERGLKNWEQLGAGEVKVIKFSDKRKELSEIAAFHYLPSDGERSLAVRNTDAKARQQIFNEQDRIP